MSQFAWFGMGSCVLWMVCGRSSGLEQLQQVVGEADDLPFRCGFFPASHQEAPQSPPFFDLSKYRLHDRLAHLVVPLILNGFLCPLDGLRAQFGPGTTSAGCG